MSKKILITGGAGFIGSHLAEKLLKDGEEVFVVDNLSTGSMDNIKHLQDNQSFHFTKGSIMDKNLIVETVAKVDEIYHLAAAVGVKNIMDNPLNSFLVNIDGTKNILDVAAAKDKKPRILIASSSEVYGKNENIPFTEESDRTYGSILNLRWGYGLSKSSDEFLALAYFKEKQVPTIVTRFFNVIGPRQTGAYGMVVPRFVKQALAEEPITIYGNGGQTRCFTYIGDIVEALTNLMDCPEALGKVFNLGSEEEVTIKELAQKVKELTKSKSEVTFTPYADVYGPNFEDMLHRRPDITKIKNLIGYQPKFNLEESLKKIIDHFHAN